MTIALRVLALDEEALRGRNVGFTANSAVCTENRIRVYQVTESAKLAQ